MYQRVNRFPSPFPSGNAGWEGEILLGRKAEGRGKAPPFGKTPRAAGEKMLKIEIGPLLCFPCPCFPTLDGRVKMRISAGFDTDQKLRLKDRDLSKGKTGERGDFYMTLRVAVPEKVRAEETTVCENLREVSKFPPRDASHA